MTLTCHTADGDRNAEMKCLRLRPHVLAGFDGSQQRGTPSQPPAQALAAGPAHAPRSSTRRALSGPTRRGEGARKRRHEGTFPPLQTYFFCRKATTPRPFPPACGSGHERRRMKRGKGAGRSRADSPIASEHPAQKGTGVPRPRRYWAEGRATATSTSAEIPGGIRWHVSSEEGTAT